MPKSSGYIAKLPDRRGLIHYSDAENRVWQDLYRNQLPRVAEFAAGEYLNGLARLDLPADRVPQCAEITHCLRDYTGWSYQPVPALIGFREFFDMLSRRCFPAASFIRRREHFDYVEEPDIFHEIFGHAPLLTDSRFAGFSEAIGRAGLIADPVDYAWLIRLYWFTIEFGLSRESGVYKAFGSGLVSSPTELPYSVNSRTPQRLDFELVTVLRTPYRIDIHQPLYFLQTSFDDLFEITRRDLIKDVKQARRLGLLAPLYPVEPKQSDDREVS